MLVQSLAWPVAAVAIAALFRAEVRLVLERIVRLKYRDFEAQFRRDLAESEGLADTAGPKRLLDLPGESRRVLPEFDSPIADHRIGSPGPRVLVESAWSSLSDAADRAAGTAGIDPLPALAGHGHLSGRDLLLFDRIRRLRTQVVEATEWEPSPDDAARYAALAGALADRLGRAAGDRKSGGKTA
jgi:hypothetical protein